MKIRLQCYSCFKFTLRFPKLVLDNHSFYLQTELQS